MTKGGAQKDTAGVLVINPGSTSTKTAFFRGGDPDWMETIEHPQEELERFQSVSSQRGWREDTIREQLDDKAIKSEVVDAIVGRGGLLRPLKGGVYAVTDAMCRDLERARYGEHASNLGALLAKSFAQRFGVRAFVVDPVTVDEFEAASRISGVPGIERKCRNHALNIKAVARRAAAESDRALEQTAFVVAHLGGGISVCALRGGRIIDSTDALLGEGPFSAERAGTLPIAGMLELCYDSDMSCERVVRLLSRESGLKGYLNETRLPEVYQRINSGDASAREVLDALVRQIVKWIGAMAAVLHCAPDAIILTGGMTHSDQLVGEINEYVRKLGQVKVYPGEFEMEALAEGAIRVLQGEEDVVEYQLE